LEAAVAYDLCGGLPVPWFDGLTETFGFSPLRMRRRARLLAVPSPDPRVYDAERIRWFVLGPGDAVLSGYADDWVRRGLARTEARFGALRVVRLLPFKDGVMVGSRAASHDTTVVTDADGTYPPE
jgi:hypothetical protein